MYTVTFSPGETTTSFAVQIIDDDFIEIDEILEFMILPDLLPADVGIDVPNRATITVIDDTGNCVCCVHVHVHVHVHV